MNVLVTGGAGYIGSVITDELINRGHKVVVIDNLSKGHRGAVSERAHLIEVDLIDADRVQAVLQSDSVEAVIHMAASSLVGESVTAPDRYYHNNVIASLVLFQAMLASDVRMIVFSSTAAVYGESPRQPVQETDPMAPTNPYGETKLAIERALHWYGQAHGIRHVSLRYFNAAGATERRGERHSPETHLIPLVLEAARRPDSIVTVFGDDYPTLDGTCVRDYIHVADLARAHVLALDGLSESAIHSEAFNLGTGRGYTVREVIETARAVTGRDIAERVGPRRPGDPPVLVAAPARGAEALGWRPERSSLEEIVSSAWNWMMSHC